MNYSESQLETLAINAGFPADQASTAAAVALAESGGNPNPPGYNDAGNSFGLWQINRPTHPEFADWNLLDPQTNANAAFSVWQRAGGSFSPWTTYRTGAYLAFLPTSPATAAVSVQAPDGSFSVPVDAPAITLPAGLPLGVVLAGGALGLWLLADLLGD